MLEHLPLIVFLVTFVLIFVLRMPIPAGMIAACTLYFLTDGLIKGVGFGALITGAGGSLHLVAQKTIEAIFTNGTIVAVPLFIFAANVMNAGKITEYVFGTCMGLVGRFRGGLAHVNVLASLVFSGMTGSAIADASGLGKLEIDAMRKEGYDDGFSCAITAASATIGPIFPPSIPMVVYAMLTGASVGDMFKSGMGIGGLLMEGIGDTLRVSLTDEPENEVYAGYDILRAAGYAVAGPEIISCPTCGRTQYPMIEIANEVEARLRDEGFKKPLKIAIMGCVVNGPGEASDADIGIAGGKDEALLFIRGEKIRMLKGDIVGQLLEEIHKM